MDLCPKVIFGNELQTWPSEAIMVCTCQRRNSNFSKNYNNILDIILDKPVGTFNEHVCLKKRQLLIVNMHLFDHDFMQRSPHDTDWTRSYLHHVSVIIISQYFYYAKILARLEAFIIPPQVPTVAQCNNSFCRRWHR